jgi:phospholipid/cholesterol/gamma-HCH transport system substrate-binding protein
MPRQQQHLARLGFFVLAAGTVLIVALFLIGKNQHLLGSHFVLRAHFRNVAGLRTGNNVRFSGIEVGTVREMRILNDSTLEVTLLVKEDMKQVIRRNAIASLGADGLMGNKVVNILPQAATASYVKDGDLLSTRAAVEIDDVLRTLASTGDNIHAITESLKATTARINESRGLWTLIEDEQLAHNINAASGHLNRAAAEAEGMTKDVRSILADVRSGKGPAGVILRDTAMGEEIRSSMSRLAAVSRSAENLAADLDAVTKRLGNDLQDGKGPLNLVLRDTSVSGRISRSLLQVESGTGYFNQSMEALRHHFLFRSYFRRKEKQQQSHR